MQFQNDEADDADLFDDMEAALAEQMEHVPPSPHRRKKARHEAHGEPGDFGLGGLAYAAGSVKREASTATVEDDDDEDGDEAAGYMWGMNILTGRSREQDEADGLIHKRTTQLRYGSYQGLQLGASEVRRIKAEECEAMLRRKRLGLVLDLDHTLLNSATYHELDDEARKALDAWARKERGLPPLDASADGEKVETAGGETAGGEAADGDGQKLGDEGGGISTAASSSDANGISSRSAGNSAAEQLRAAMKAAATAGAGNGKATVAAASPAAAPDPSAASDSEPLLYHLGHIHMWTKLRPYASTAACTRCPSRTAYALATALAIAACHLPRRCACIGPSHPRACVPTVACALLLACAFLQVCA